MGQFASLFEKSGESLHVLLLEDQVLVDSSDWLVEQHLSPVSQHGYIFPRWLYNFLWVVAHSIIIRLSSSVTEG